MTSRCADPACLRPRRLVCPRGDAHDRAAPLLAAVQSAEHLSPATRGSLEGCAAALRCCAALLRCVLRCAVLRVDNGSSGGALHSAKEPDSDAGLVGQRAVAVVGEGSTAAPELVHLRIPETAVEVKYDRGRPLRHARATLAPPPPALCWRSSLDSWAIQPVTDGHAAGM